MIQDTGMLHFQRLAILLFGLVSSTLLTVPVVPDVYIVRWTGGER